MLSFDFLCLPSLLSPRAGGRIGHHELLLPHGMISGPQIHSERMVDSRPPKKIVLMVAALRQGSEATNVLVDSFVVGDGMSAKKRFMVGDETKTADASLATV